MRVGVGEQDGRRGGLSEYVGTGRTFGVPWSQVGDSRWGGVGGGSMGGWSAWSGREVYKCTGAGGC